MTRSKKAGFFLILLFSIMVFLPLISPIDYTTATGNGVYSGSHNSTSSLEWDPDLYTYWNNRIEISVTEPNKFDRVNEPVSIFLNFDFGTARIGKFRVLFYNGSTWVDTPTQVWNMSITGEFVDSATITFLTNITKGTTQIYYLYYTDQSSASIPTYYYYVTPTNGTFTHPSVYDYSYTHIEAQTYEAKLCWEISSVLDFIINGYDLFGEYRDDIIPIDIGNIMDSDNQLRGEVRDMPEGEVYGDGRDQATLVNFTWGPCFTQISTFKNTGSSDYIDITKIWTFYPNYWTLECKVQLTPGYNHNYIVYGRSFHNGSSSRSSLLNTLEGNDNVIDGSSHTIRYDSSYHTVTINANGGTESHQKNIYIQPYWAAIYKTGTSGFAYSNIPSPDSYDQINQYAYYDSLYSDIVNMYGASGWALTGSPISSSHPWQVKLYYFPHGTQSSYGDIHSDSFFAQQDYVKVNNPLEISISSDRESKIHNYIILNLKDELGSSIFNATVELFNHTGDYLIETKYSNSSGIVIFEKILDSYTYNISIYYDINTQLKLIKNMTLTGFTANFTRKATYDIQCSLTKFRILLIDSGSGNPLYNFSIRVNSTLNNIDFSRSTDVFGWYNFTLSTYSSSFYDVNITSPDGSPISYNITSAFDISITHLIWVFISQPKFVTALDLIQLDYIPKIGTIDVNRTVNSISKYIEIFYGDNISSTIKFLNITPEPDLEISDATWTSWEILDGTTILSSGILQNIGNGNYTIDIGPSSYLNHWNETLTLRLNAFRSDGNSPAAIDIVLKIKTWDIEASESVTADTIYYDNVFSNYLRENVTLMLNLEDQLSTSINYLDLPETDFNISIPGISYNFYSIENYPTNNGSVLINFNLTLSGIGIYSVNIKANSSYYSPIELTYILRIDPIPIQMQWSSTNIFEIDNETIRGAFNESIPIILTVSSIPTTHFQEEILENCNGFFAWDKESLNINETGNGVYEFDLSLSNLTQSEIQPGIYTLSTLISKQNYTTITLELNLDLIYEWNTIVTIVEKSAGFDIGMPVYITYRYSANLAPRIGNGLESANVTIESTDWENDGWPTESWAIEELGGGLYKITYDTSFLIDILNASQGTSFAFQPVVTFSLNTYQTTTENEAFSVTLVIGIPFEFLIVIASVIGVSVPLGYRGYRYYKWAKLPPIIKKIQKTTEGIKKESTFVISSPVKREFLLREKLDELFSEVGVSPAIKGTFESAVSSELKIESTALYEEISKQVDEALPHLPSDERASLLNELINIPSKEREFLIKSLKEQRQETKEMITEDIDKSLEDIKEKLTPKVTDIIQPEISKEIENLFKEGIITKEEKAVLGVELSRLTPEDQKKFLDKIKKR